MAVLAAPGLFLRIPNNAVTVHTDLEPRSAPAPLLEKRIAALTRFGSPTIVLVSVAVLAWVALKLVIYWKFGGFAFGWLGRIMAVLIVLVVGAEFWASLYRRCLGGKLLPVRVFISEGKKMLELTVQDGQPRSALSLAGTTPTTAGFSILRRVVMVYEAGGKTRIGTGPLAAGELPALVDGGFKVICDERWPRRAALLTNYDFEPAAGEAE